MEEASFIDNHIYVGTLAAATNERLLHQLSISLIVDCANQYYQPTDTSIQLIHHNVRNHGVLSIKDYFESLHQEIDSYVKVEKNVLIHCYYGMTRSCSCAIAYFMWKKKCSYDEAYNLVKSQRSVCDIPFDLEEYLREYGNQLNGIRNEKIDHIEYNSIIKITIPSTLHPEELIAKMSHLPNIVNGLHIGRHECSPGYYGTKEMEFEVYIAPEKDEEEIEFLLQDYFENVDIHSIQITRMDA